MGTVVGFPKRHDCSPSKLRDASSVNKSAVTPAPFTRPDASTAVHHSAGIRSRPAHLRAAKGDAPISCAIASADGHSRMMDRKDDMSDATFIESDIRQSVLNCKPILSHETGRDLADTCPMAKAPTDKQYQDAILQRTFSAREHRGITQEAAAHALGTDQPTYAKYERRTPLPHRHIWAFCIACNVTVEWLITGQGKGVPLLERPPAKSRRGRKPKPRKVA